MSFSISPSGQARGASVCGIDLGKALERAQVARIREAWVEHGVLVFPDQHINDDDLERFQCRHQWSSNMLLMWDNRSVLHRATGGYEGFGRLLHRTTIASAA